MSYFPIGQIGNFGDEKLISTTQKMTLGKRMVLPDGSVYYYTLAGATALAAGKLCMQAAGDASADMDLTVALAGAIGDRTVTVDLEAGAVAKNAFAQGYLYINDATGEGHKYRIKSHPAAAGSDELIVTLDEPLVTTLVLDTSLAGLMANPYSAAVVWDVSAIVGVPLGVPPCTITAAYYGWMQTWGWSACLYDAAVCTLGSAVMPADTAVDGAVEVRDPATATPSIGMAGLIAAVDTDYGMVFLTIAP